MAVKLFYLIAVHSGNSGWLNVTFVQSGRKLQRVFYDKKSTHGQRNTSITLGEMTLALDRGDASGSITVRAMSLCCFSSDALILNSTPNEDYVFLHLDFN